MHTGCYIYSGGHIDIVYKIEDESIVDNICTAKRRALTRYIQTDNGGDNIILPTCV